MGRTSPKTAGMTAADWIILTGAGSYLAWTVVPSWYRVGEGEAFGIPLPSYTFNGWRGTTLFAAVAAIVAIPWLGLRLGGVRLRSLEPTIVDVILAAAGLVLTLLVPIVRPTTGLGKASLSWALPVAMLIAALWAYGAQRKYRERRTAHRSRAVGGSGFTAGVRP